jgi:hypothetical protein
VSLLRRTKEKLKRRDGAGEMLAPQGWKASKNEEGNLHYYFVLFTLYISPSVPLGVSYCARCAKYIVFTKREKYSKDHF